MKSICVFNNKGGVGKTTLLCNLAAYFSTKRSKKVLVIDCDPQCNATAYMLIEDTLEKIYSKETGTINDLIKPLRKGKGFLDTPLPIIKSPGFQVDLIPGDPKFAIAEDFLSRDWVDAIAGQERGLQTTAFVRDLLEKCKDYDLVFFDVGPSLGAINRAILLSTDFFLIPMSSDIFSIRGLQNIEVAVKTWQEDLAQGLRTYKKREGEAYKLHNKELTVRLKFLGYVTQQYTAKTVDGKKQPVKAYEKLIRRVEPGIKKHIIDVFNPGSTLDYKVGEIPYLQSVVPMSQSVSKPIFSLGSADGVVGAHFEKVRDSLNVFASIGKKVEKHISALS
jgi:cellulose biosynthesis protein BcsQ